MKTFLLTTTAALALSASAASASWTGCRIGIGGSVIASTTEATAADTLGIGIGLGIDSFGTQDVAPTLSGGCDFQAGSFVIGALADFTFNKSEWNTTLTAPGLTASVDTSFENMWTVGARAGYLITPTTLVYGMAGYSAAESKSIDVVANGANIVSFGVGDLSGWHVGAGIDTKMTDFIIIGLSYRFTRFETETVNLAPLPATLDLDTDVHQVMATLSYRFGPSDSLSPMK